MQQNKILNLIFLYLPSFPFKWLMHLCLLLFDQWHQKKVLCVPLSGWNLKSQLWDNSSTVEWVSRPLHEIKQFTLAGEMRAMYAMHRQWAYLDILAYRETSCLMQDISFGNMVWRDKWRLLTSFSEDIVVLTDCKLLCILILPSVMCTF